MGRRARPPKGKAEVKRPLARKSPKNGGARVRALEKRLAEALEQQTATAEILRVISSSPTDAQPVFDAIAASAMRLCDGELSVVARYDGELLHLAAHAHVGSEGVDLIRQLYPTPPSSSIMTAP